MSVCFASLYPSAMVQPGCMDKHADTIGKCLHAWPCLVDSRLQPSSHAAMQTANKVSAGIDRQMQEGKIVGML